MQSFPKTIILRHRKENLKKCSLRGLEFRNDMQFFSYPLSVPLPDLANYILLTMDAPTLTATDAGRGLLLIDATWRYAAKMVDSVIHIPRLETRTLPSHFRTAYPRVQTECPDPERGLASVEALYIAYMILGYDSTGLLDHYHWKDTFLKWTKGQ